MTTPTTGTESAAAYLAATSSDDEIDLVEVAAAVLRGKWTVLLLAFAGAALAAVALLFIPVTFKATVELLPPPLSRTSAAASLLSTSGGADLGSLGGLGSALQSKSSADTFIVLLQAWPIHDALVQRFHLMDVYKSATVAGARDVLGARTGVSASKEGVVSITVTDQDRQRCADLANGYVDAVRSYMRSVAFSEASQRRVFYEGQLNETKEDLSRAEVNFKQMQQQSGMLSLDSQAKALLETAETLRAQITAKQVELQSLRSYSTKSNPQVQIAETELGALQGQLSQVESRGQGGLTGKSLSSVPASEVDFIRATREMKYQEGLFDLMVKQYEGARIDEARDAPAIQVIEPALVPEHKAGPKRLLLLASGFAVGLVIGLCVVLFRYWKSSLSPDALAAVSQLRRAAFGGTR